MQAQQPHSDSPAMASQSTLIAELPAALLACTSRLPCPDPDVYAYQPTQLALDQALLGRPETQFQAALPPDWGTVRSLSEQLLQQAHDVRALLSWTLAGVAQHQLQALAILFEILRHWTCQFWEDVYPPLEATDWFERQNCIMALELDPLWRQSLRDCVWVKLPALGEIRLSQLAHAVDPQNNPSSGLQSFSKAQIMQALQANPQVTAPLHNTITQVSQALQRFRAEWLLHTQEPIEFKALQYQLSCLQQVLPGLDTLVQQASGLDTPKSNSAESTVIGQSAHPAPAGSQSFDQGIHTREQALMAIDQVCAFLQRTEPSNPAPWFLKRARHLVDKNFLELLHELAPDSLPAVARIVGVNPDDVVSNKS